MSLRPREQAGSNLGRRLAGRPALLHVMCHDPAASALR